MSTNLPVNWQCVRLELDRSDKFPQGSVSRAYLLRLPLGDDGMVDRQAFAAMPHRATMRRFWPSEADSVGYVRLDDGAIAFVSAARDGAEDEVVARLDPVPIREGARLVLTDPGGERLPFRVANVKPVGQRR